ncbi:MAG: TIR domain-containing protein [Xenococcus sp. (in: cyanobacteria)]
MTRIFISHSYLDEAIAYKLVTFLLAALRLEDEDICCSSDPDLGLSYRPSSLTDQLKEKLKSSEALIILITDDSLHSAWIPFETGTFWTTDKLVIPILGPGLKQNDLPGPLRNFLSISIEANGAEDKLNNAIVQVARELNIEQKVTKRRNGTLKEFVNALKAWQSKRPAVPNFQQEVEQLKAQIQELEQVHKEQLEQLENALTLSQEEKEELERDHQEQKQKLEQELALRIKQLEKEQEHSQELKEQERSLKLRIEQLEEERDQKDDEILSLREKLKEQSFELHKVLERLGLTFNQEVLNYENIIKEDIRKFVQKEKDRRGEEVLHLSEEQLKKLFEIQWDSWISNLRVQYKNPNKKVNIEQDIIQILIETAPKDWKFIDEKRKQKSNLRDFKLTDFCIEEKYYEWHWEKVIKKGFKKISKGEIPKDQRHQVILEIEGFKNKLFNEIDKDLQEKEHNLQPYQSSYIRDILHKITNRIEEKSKKLLDKTSFSLTADFEIDLTIVICGHIIKQLERIDQNFRKAQNPIIKIEQQKEFYFDIFKVSFNKENSHSAMVSHLLRVLSEGMLEKVQQELADKIYYQMKSITHSKILNDKQSFIANILISLAKKGSLNDYMTYIHYPVESIENWVERYVQEFNSKDKGIAGIIKTEVNNLVDAAKDFVERTNRYIETESQDASKIRAWTEKFHELAKNNLIFKNLEKIETFGSEIDNIDFDYIGEQVNEGIDSKKSELITELRKFSEPTTNQYSYLKENVVNKIFESVIGCINTCPLCGEICIHGRAHRFDINHETPYHRPLGVLGLSVDNKLMIENCPQLIASNLKFKNSDTNQEFVYYKNYRQVNDYYGSWKINPDLSLEGGSYWKWFMANYSNQLAEYYGKEKPDIPSTWKFFTKEKEIEKLRRLIDFEE